MTKAFAGLRVLDFSTTIAGPHCGRMLADMGAEVTKIETDGGETMPTRAPLRNGCSTVFGQLNVGKNSLVLDLKSPKGAEAVRRLVATADVLVENFRPGVMRRVKLDYASLQPLNPKLVYCSVSGFGLDGPYAQRGGFDLVTQAMSGLMSFVGEVGSETLTVRTNGSMQVPAGSEVALDWPAAAAHHFDSQGRRI